MRIDDAIAEIDIVLKERIDPTVQRMENGVEPFDLDETFESLIMLADTKARLRDVESRLNTLMVEYMRHEGEKVIMRGEYTAERKVSSSRKNWQHGTLIEAIVNVSLSEELGSVVDANTGEVVDLTYISRPLIDSVVENLSRAAAIREWRVKDLRALVPGLNPDDFCEVEKAERVSIRKKN